MLPLPFVGELVYCVGEPSISLYFLVQGRVTEAVPMADDGSVVRGSLTDDSNVNYKVHCKYHNGEFFGADEIYTRVSRRRVVTQGRRTLTHQPGPNARSPKCA